ncbi:MAG: ferredoxin [Candidatus Omnitrophica bacterium]|nr:ferredoxin [Candidatus Omnitrophota bacterium]MBU4479425.1 ferredoxin [Candidatus Omnitrophota bacterium]MCG2703970.1 DUF2148 domain-containing protein [Candidatus Omnitrophota bacterium]
MNMRNSKLMERNALKQVAGFMCAAARTAPKAKGVDNIAAIIMDTEKEKNMLIKQMLIAAKKENKPGFERDALNLKQSPVIVLIGTKTAAIGLTCGFCGFKDCAAMEAAAAVCSYNPMDLGIAVGSAAGIAADFHIDNRIMYSAGKIAVEMNLFKDKKITIALAIPLSASGKNIFFDRTK